jgi:small subunit ribosomal protein S6
MRGLAPEQRKKEGHFMPLYEHVFLARQDISPQQVDAMVQSFRQLLEEKGGKIGKTEYWGLKSLTYRIKKNRKAHYTLINIDAPHEAVAELERQERLSTDVIRFLTIKVDEHDETPSAMMRRSDRDERDGRGDRGDRGDRRGGGRRDRDREYGSREPREDIETETVDAADDAEDA